MSSESESARHERGLPDCMHKGGQARSHACRVWKKHARRSEATGAWADCQSERYQMKGMLTNALTHAPWLTDRTHTLYPSGYFCVLKSKPLLSFLSLFSGGDSGFRIGLAAQIDARNQFVAATQSIVHPLPANLHIARTPKPMRVNKTASLNLSLFVVRLSCLIDML